VTAAIVISEADNVATVLDAVAPGGTVSAGGSSVTAIDAIPCGHKIARRAISSGERIVKYGSAIGTASRDIAAGAHVHTHNVASERGRGDLAAQPVRDDEARIAEPVE
jgi:altronate dehydratase